MNLKRQRLLAGCTLIDVETSLKETPRGTTLPLLDAAGPAALALAALAVLAALTLSPAILMGQTAPASAGPPPSTGGFFPLSEVRAGMTATAWTVFTGTSPEPMEVEILGVLRGARGPGHDMILAQLHGAKPEYTGVVAGMSGSPVYIGKRLLGSLSFRIGQFSKDPIAGITPIGQMLEVRDLPLDDGTLLTAGTRSPILIPGSEIPAPAAPASDLGPSGAGMTFQAMETPLTMSGFGPEAIRLWQQKMAGTGLEMVSAGGVGGSSDPIAGTASHPMDRAPVLPGSAVTAQLVRGDLEIAATCTVTYVDPKQLLACGHPILQAGPVSLPMTRAEVVATLASPLNAFKIINTGDTIGAFTEDRDAAIRGVLGAQARMIPVHIEVHGSGVSRKLNIEVLDLPSLTPQALLVSLYEILSESNEASSDTSYHLTGSIDLAGHASPIDVWAPASDQLPASLSASLLATERFAKIYLNWSRRGAIRSIDIHVEAVPRRVQVELEGARLVSSDIVHAGDTVMVEATLRPWQQPARNVRIPVTLPGRLGAGGLRLLVSDAATLDRTLDQPRQSTRAPDLDTVLAQAGQAHAADRIYVSLLVPETQAGMAGRTLTSLPLSMANAFEPMRASQDVSLNGESAELAGDAPAGGVLSGFQVLNLRIEPGGGLD